MTFGVIKKIFRKHRFRNISRKEYQVFKLSFLPLTLLGFIENFSFESDIFL